MTGSQDLGESACGAAVTWVSTAYPNICSVKTSYPTLWQENPIADPYVVLEYRKGRRVKAQDHVKTVDG